MNAKKIYVGNTDLNTKKPDVDGGFVEIDNERFYKISNSDQMPDFFMSIVSDSDHWMFISSNGSLSAGRKNRDNALFPYYTVDKIHDYKGITGNKTILLVQKDEKTFLWEPFSDELNKIYNTQRNLYKSIYGNKIIFEEINHDLGIAFQYGWYNSEEFGFVKKSTISNLQNSDVAVEIIDGITNIIPYGFDYQFQNEYSNLLDAYKKNELVKESGLGLFMLSSIPVDRAEPSESLMATTVWSTGLNEEVKNLLSINQLQKFKNGQPLETETDVRATRGAYLINAEIELKEGDKKTWYFVAEINQNASDVANLNQFILDEKKLTQKVEEDIVHGTSNLSKIVSLADGIQMSNDELGFARHFSNTLFNVMRGGIFINGYQIDVEDFKLFAKTANRSTFKELDVLLKALPKSISYLELIDVANGSENPDIIRICYEYLPLTFSRRHGDPSRPWNLFSIETKSADGSTLFNYQGNWRDIFQNWEALSLSFPEYVEGIISKFVNASTSDGYNPYRISRNGIDWECPDPDDPWAYIGYWGDHQIIYLQKLLELSNNYHPGRLKELLTKEIFAYANVPYRIKSYEDMVKNPQDTIEFDDILNLQIRKNVGKIGSDARLLMDTSNNVYRVNFMEKILVTLLSKLSNFIPEAGIWLNTQRPEWNDANNALVGNGVSMVTLYYIRRFLKFWADLLENDLEGTYGISEEVTILFEEIHNVFVQNQDVLETGFSDQLRLEFANQLGAAGTNYRNSVYKHSFSGKKKELHNSQLKGFIELAIDYMDQSIRANKREDGLYHAYNLIAFSSEGITIRYLYEMLEGQVAVLSSGYLSAQEGLDVLDALKSSKLFREDQYSYILYPDRLLPRFQEKNNIPVDQVLNSNLLSKLIEDSNSSVVINDKIGRFHFNGSIRNADVLNEAIDRLDERIYGDLVAEEKQKILDIYEEMFDHQSFTGRSGTFYGYEGLGCIYWHMVSKLLLAAQETFFRAIKEDASPELIGKIKDHYFEIKAGIGLSKSPELHGAFPTDAYSHTPSTAGAKQPGMTGQVKEDYISRMGELGVHVKDGAIEIDTALMNLDEFLKQESTFSYYDLEENAQTIKLQQGQLAFTICQVPVVFTLSKASKFKVTMNDGTQIELDGKTLSSEISNKIFKRNGEIERIEVFINT